MISPYLAGGIISIRACIRDALDASGKNSVDVSCETGLGRWIQELGEDMFSLYGVRSLEPSLHS